MFRVMAGAGMHPGAPGRAVRAVPSTVQREHANERAEQSRERRAVERGVSTAGRDNDHALSRWSLPAARTVRCAIKTAQRSRTSGASLHSVAAESREPGPSATGRTGSSDFTAPSGLERTVAHGDGGRARMSGDSRAPGRAAEARRFALPEPRGPITSSSVQALLQGHTTPLAIYLGSLLLVDERWPTTTFSWRSTLLRAALRRVRASTNAGSGPLALGLSRDARGEIPERTRRRSSRRPRQTRPRCRRLAAAARRRGLGPSLSRYVETQATQEQLWSTSSTGRPTS